MSFRFLLFLTFAQELVCPVAADDPDVLEMVSDETSVDHASSWHRQNGILRTRSIRLIDHHKTEAHTRQSGHEGAMWIEIAIWIASSCTLFS